ncbi:MAG: hypothetical protein F6K14_17415 [Symploca sp. SIO2C1]|nr:hypothetical protein [Symploca sp. SIO2C1]
MTFEEMQKIIEKMLSVQREIKASQPKFKKGQRELQEGQVEFQKRQLKFEESQEKQKIVLYELSQKYRDLAEHSIRQREILDRLISYRLTNESDHLNLEEKLRAIEARRKRFENQT